MFVDLMEKYGGGEESSEQSTFAEPPKPVYLRGTNSRFPPSRSLQLLQQDGHPGGQWDCLDLDIVDACRGTSVSQSYRGNFKLYDGNCKGDFVDGLPIYISSDRPNRPLYIYPLGVYPDGWSVAALRGLVRWRIVSFENFDDKRSCRIETANVFQIEFAADGQPYNYYPTIYCFDQNGNDFSGFKSSTINIRCNDKADTIGGNSPSDGGNNKVVVAIGIILCLVVLVLAAYYYWRRSKNRGQILCPSPRPKSTDNDDCESRYYPQNRADESHNTRDSRLTRGSRGTRDTGTKDRRYTGDTGSSDSRKIGECVDVSPLTSLKNDSPTYVNGNKTPDTVYLPTLEEGPTYVDDVIEDPINDLSTASEKTGNFPGKLKIPEIVSKLAQTTGNHSSDAISDHQPSVSYPPPSPQRESRANSSSVPSRNSSHKTPVPAPSGHGLNGDSRPAPQRHPSRSAVSKDITDIVEKIDQELNEVISSGEGSRHRNKDDYGRSPSMDDERADRARSRSVEDPPQRRFGGLGSSSSHIRDRPQNGAGGSQHRGKDPLMDLSRRSKFREIRKTFSDRSRALGRTLAGDDKRSRSEERSRPETYAARGRDTSGHKDDRSRFMDRWVNANTNKGRSRSQSRERAEGCTGRRGRERSNHGDKRDGRSLSRERSKVAEYYSNRNRPTAKDRYDSNGYSDRDKKRNRSRSTDLSHGNEFANRNRPSKASASDYGSSPQTDRNFSDNKRMAASDHGGKRNGVPPGRDRIASSSEHSRKPSSDAWTSAGEQAAKRRGRSNSLERARHDYCGRSQSPYKDRNRSQSKDGANDSADRKRRSSRDRSGHGPSGNQSSRNPSFSSPLETGGGRGTLDASNLNRSVTKNPDGSVTVAVKRTREDGAIVTTKIKYASVSLARRHGIEVD
ncbi:hypothetical protein IV203_021814 [Nitzschia inconspicua]|uniref:Uncharacterized protein n=1 Tax=Nitzschia inconspicua TaxID=303405 RepID=A0A9K3KI35_9STRA|nr:hypothetical protein IV203_021814 [Nitzschia inconspicua]